MVQLPFDSYVVFRAFYVELPTLCYLCMYIYKHICISRTYISSDLSSIMYVLQCQRGTIHKDISAVVCPVSLLVREMSNPTQRERERDPRIIRLVEKRKQEQ